MLRMISENTLPTEGPSRDRRIKMQQGKKMQITKRIIRIARTVGIFPLLCGADGGMVIGNSFRFELSGKAALPVYCITRPKSVFFTTLLFFLTS
jgi:hypothetical protein